MRCLRVILALVIGSFAFLLLAPEEAQACHRRGSGAVVYYAPAPAYYQPSYAPPMYYPPRPFYAQPMPYLPPSGPGPSPSRPTTTVNVAANDDAFDPAELKVEVGTTVRWENKGKHKHTVTSAAGLWDSGDIPPGGTYSATFSQPGTYPYLCRHHVKEKMQGVVIVGAPTGGGTPIAPDK